MTILRLMSAKYLFPIDFAKLVAGERLPKVNEELSIRHHIYMILTTQLGRHRFNAEYGCALWNHDFSLKTSETKSWKSKIEETIQETLGTLEPRIDDKFQVKTEVIERKDTNENGMDNISRQFKIIISKLKLKRTNETLENMEYTVVFSPIILD